MSTELRTSLPVAGGEIAFDPRTGSVRYTTRSQTKILFSGLPSTAYLFRFDERLCVGGLPDGQALTFALVDSLVERISRGRLDAAVVPMSRFFTAGGGPWVQVTAVHAGREFQFSLPDAAFDEFVRELELRRFHVAQLPVHRWSVS